MTNSRSESNRPMTDGWYLGLKYMANDGFIVRAPEKIDAACHGASFLYVDDVLLLADDWRGVVADWWHALAIGGALIMWVTDCRFAEAEGLQRVTLEDVTAFFQSERGWDCLEHAIIEGHLFIVMRKRGDDTQLWRPWRKREKHALVARMGAFGDALMATSVLPALKSEGWAVSFAARTRGAEVVKGNPFIDEILTLAESQLDDDEVPAFLAAHEKRVDRFVNLTLSVEGELLKQPIRPDYFWSDRQRRALCDRSYLERIHALAEARLPYEVSFYPTPDEKKEAEKMARECGPFLLWCLRGSAVHKWWPYAPQAICQILAQTEATIVITGGSDALSLVDPICSAVENYYGDKKRLRFCVGTHSIRQIMALAQQAACAVGPETGVMHAISLEAIPKVVLLSHSSRRNLTDDWVNTQAIEPDVTCYPCHRLHFDHQWCPKDSLTGAAMCASSIRVERVVAAVKNGMESLRMSEQNEGI